MKIYQLHEYGGEWEDAFDHIVGSYLRKERAEEEKIKAEAKEKELIEHGKKCRECPFLESHLSINELFPLYSDYCSEAQLEEDEYGINCDNYDGPWCEIIFAIKEVEVEE